MIKEVQKSFWNGFFDGLALRPLWRFLAKRDIELAILAEREKCAEFAESSTAYTQFQTVEHYKISTFIAATRRSRARTSGLSGSPLTYEFTGWRLFASPRATMGYATRP